MSKLQTENKTRKNCEYPATELVLGATFSMLIDDIPASNITLDNIITYSLSGNSTTLVCDNIEGYVQDIKDKEKMLIKSNWIQNLITSIESNNNISSLKTQTAKVIVTGKTVHDVSINAINADLGKDAKADIYFLLKDNTYVGWSVKQSINATLSNYSVEKILQDIGDSEGANICASIRKNFWTSHNLPDLTSDIKKGTKEEKEQWRNMANPQFYDAYYNPNIYWKALRKYINKNIDDIKLSLVKSLCGDKVPYPLYEFNGKDIYSIDFVHDKFNEILFKEYQPFYHCGDNIEKKKRSAAKMFYILKFAYRPLNDKRPFNPNKPTLFPTKSFRVEIRWKHWITSGSPQFLIHKNHGPSPPLKYRKIKNPKLNIKK